MSIYSDLDTAIEIMAYKIAECVRKSEEDSKYEAELENLRKDRDEMYNGNMETINKIINEYGAELKKMYNSK